MVSANLTLMQKTWKKLLKEYHKDKKRLTFLVLYSGKIQAILRGKTQFKERLLDQLREPSFHQRKQQLIFSLDQAQLEILQKFHNPRDKLQHLTMIHLWRWPEKEEMKHKRQCGPNTGSRRSKKVYLRTAETLEGVHDVYWTNISFSLLIDSSFSLTL